MADEITASLKLSFTKNGVTEDMVATGLQIDMSGSKYIKNVQSIATSETALQKGSVGTPGFCLMKNLDATNFVSVRGSTGAANCAKIKPGEAVLLRFSGSAPYLIADTAAVSVEYLLIED